MNFEVKGKLKKNGILESFTRTVEAASEKLAGEKLKCLFGSEHKTSRRHIIIETVNKSGDGNAPKRG